MKQLTIFILLLCSSYSFSQKNDRIYLADTLEGWFRFEKNRHSLRFFTGINIYERKNEGGQKTHTMYSPTITLGYGYTPIDRLLLNLDVLYEYSFNKPFYDHKSFNYHFNASYIFFGKQRFFMAPGL